ncbi:MAG: SRPBCC family protein [Campylobacterales bacterium]|nr:SRPBCC family protein [Campylobacterales bacterium]
MTHQRTYTCLVHARPDELFDFHTDTHNLLRITPPWIGVSIVSMDAPLREHSEVVLRIKRFGLATLWRMRLENVKPPHTLCDRMVRGPFTSFVHERTFSALNETQSQMRETITFSLPLGALGRIALFWVGRDMDAMFAYRHRATQDFFASQH